MARTQTSDVPDLDQDTERRILDAAHTVFLRQGTAGARMQEIAEEAGVNKALLHYYFRTKDRLALAVFQRAARGLLPPVVATLGSDLPLEEKVREVVRIELDVLSRSPSLPGYVISELNHHPERAAQLASSLTGLRAEGILPTIMSTLGPQIEERVRAGTMRPIAPEHFVVNLIALCLFPFAARPMLQALMQWDAPAFERFIDERRRHLADFYLSALRP